jgi:hypothetical protein
MNRRTTTWALIAGALGTFGAERAASACGGCFHPPTQTASDITDERMLLSVSTLQTTLYDQIRYSGSPTAFAWVLPIHGTVDVGLSADVLFDSVDVLTQTTIVPPVPNCPSPACRAPVAQGAANNAGLGGGGDSTVVVTKQQNVGPYATVQLHSSDTSALDNWLLQNGFLIPDAVVPVLSQYVAEGFDFLAMKLLPGQGVQAMRPVRVTSPGASLSLPLRMAAVGTGASVGITIWVVGDGRYEPQNFPFFHIDDSELVWDFNTNLSNYTTLRLQHESALGNSGWEIESSIDLNEQLITNVILSGGQYYQYTGGGGAVVGVGSAGPVSDPSQDYLPVGDPDAGADAGQTAEEVRTADIAALFAGMTGPNVRMTRVRSDIAHIAMTADLVFRAATDQSNVSNVRNVTQSINLTCPIYNGCTVVGTGTPAQAAASVDNGNSGCAAAPVSRNRGAVTWACGALLALGVVGGGRAIRARRRRRARQG